MPSIVGQHPIAAWFAHQQQQDCTWLTSWLSYRQHQHTLGFCDPNKPELELSLSHY